MSDKEALLAAIAASPNDDLPRLVYADWLEERGDEVSVMRAMLIRAQCKLGRMEKSNREFVPLSKDVHELQKKSRPSTII